MSQRKHPRQIGVNLELAKKERDRKSLKIGKDRRASLIQRHRKVMEDTAAEEEEAEEEGSTSEVVTLNLTPINLVSDMPPQTDKRMRRMLEMKSVLFHPDPSVHLPACVYFRKALAIDKHPPLELVFICDVIPRLVELLAKSTPDIQYECSWSLTNMACGEKHHVEALVNMNVVPLALNLMVGSSYDDVREQCLWLVGNLASNPDITRESLLHHGVMPRLLAFMQMSPQPHNSSSSCSPLSLPCSCSLMQPLYAMEQAFRQHLKQQQQEQQHLGGANGGRVVVRPPSLLAMTHVASLTSFLVSKDLPLPADSCTILAIVHLAPSLLQSPDENVVIATCTSLINIFDGSLPPSSLSSASSSGGCEVTSPGRALQLAMERGVLRRMGDIFLATASSDASRQAALSVLAVVLKAENPLCRLAVLRRNPSLSSSPSSSSAYGFQLLEWILTQLRLMERMTLEDSDISNSNNNSNEFYLHTLNCLSVMLLESSETKYADQLIRGDLHLLLLVILRRNNSFDVSSQVGRCLCSLLLRGSIEALVYLGPTLFPEVMCEMLGSSDTHLLLLALASIWHLVHHHLQQVQQRGGGIAGFLFLVQAVSQDDSLYDALVAISVHATDDEMRGTAAGIVEFADRVREEEC